MNEDKTVEKILKSAKIDTNDVYFYYLRDRNRQIFGGAALKRHNGVWCRGITLWASHLDKFSKCECKRQATKRLVHAIHTRSDDYPINYLNSDRNVVCKFFDYYPFLATEYKSKYAANLTNQEQELVGLTD